MSDQPRYLKQVLDRLRSLKAESDGWVAACPCPGHGSDGDHRPSLRVTVGEMGRVLLHCRVGCSTTDVLTALGLGYADLWPAVGEVPAVCQVSDEQEVTDEDIALRHEVYSTIFSWLKLDPEAEENLLGRGFQRYAAHHFYCTLPADFSRSVMPKLVDRFGPKLLQVPGFKPGSDGTIDFVLKGCTGILIPCRDSKTNIRALKLRRRRLNEGDPKYIYLSGGGGRKAGAVAHHPVPLVETGWLDDYVRITEGELKADLCTTCDSRFTLGLPGVAFTEQALLWLSTVDTPKEVRVAFDWPDVCAKKPVYESTCRLVQQLRDHGHNVALETWDHALEQKGIDDLYQAKLVPSVLRGEEIDRRLAEISKSLYMKLETSSWSELGWEPQPFPLEALPYALAEFVRSISETKGAPADFPGVALLTVAGACIGTTRRLQIKSDWTEFPCIYAGLVAEPGSMKTPSIKPVLAPVRRKQREAARRSEDDPDIPLEHLYSTDLTVESVNAILSKNHRGILIHQDELVSWTNSDNQYRGGRGADRQYWLKVWSSEAVKVDRKSSAGCYVHSPFICVLGGIQPDMLSGMVDRLQRQDGFLHRLLIVLPADVEETELSLASVPVELIREWEDTVDRLYCFGFDADNDPITIPFTEEAFEAWRAWYRSHQAQLLDPTFPPHLRGPWQKLKAYSARLALIIRCLEPDNVAGMEPVTKEDVERATLLINYFKNHLVGVYARLRGQPLDEHLIALRDLAMESPDRTVTVRAAMRKLRLETRSDVMTLFKRGHDLALGELTKFKHPSNNKIVDVFVIPTVEEDV